MKNELVTMAQLGLIAIEVYSQEQAVKRAKAELIDGYKDFKASKKITHIEKDSKAWKAMMKATAPQYEALKVAKNDLRNVKRRLNRAIQSQ